MVARRSDDSPDAEPRIGEDHGRTAFIVDGAVQSVDIRGALEPAGYWWSMIPDARPRRALLLGVGGGTVAQLLQRRFGPLPMLGVDLDQASLDLARATMLADVQIDLVLGDAFEFVTTTDLEFDYVCVDLYRGEQPDRRVTGRPFLRNLNRIMPNGGEVYFNLFLDRRQLIAVNRIERVLRVEGKSFTGRNVVIRARSRAQ